MFMVNKSMNRMFWPLAAFFSCYTEVLQSEAFIDTNHGTYNGLQCNSWRRPPKAKMFCLLTYMPQTLLTFPRSWFRNVTMSLYNINIIVNKQVSTHRSDINCVCTQHVCTLIQSHYSIFILYHYNVLQLETKNQNSHGGGIQQLIEPICLLFGSWEA